MTVGPRNSVLGTREGLGGSLLIFYISGSKVKVNYPRKCAISGPILVTEVRYGVSWKQEGSGGVLLAGQRSGSRSKVKVECLACSGRY